MNRFGLLQLFDFTFRHSIGDPTFAYVGQTAGQKCNPIIHSVATGSALFCKHLDNVREIGSTTLCRLQQHFFCCCVFASNWLIKYRSHVRTKRQLLFTFPDAFAFRSFVRRHLKSDNFKFEIAFSFLRVSKRNGSRAACCVHLKDRVKWTLLIENTLEKQQSAFERCDASTRQVIVVRSRSVSIIRNISSLLSTCSLCLQTLFVLPSNWIRNHLNASCDTVLTPSSRIHFRPIRTLDRQRCLFRSAGRFLFIQMHFDPNASFIITNRWICCHNTFRTSCLIFITFPCNPIIERLVCESKNGAKIIVRLLYCRPQSVCPSFCVHFEFVDAAQSLCLIRSRSLVPACPSSTVSRSIGVHLDPQSTRLGQASTQ